MRFVLPHHIKKNRVLFESDGPYDNGWILFLYCVNNRKDLDCWFYCSYKYRDYIPNKYKKKTIYYPNGVDKPSIFGRLKTYRKIYTCEMIFDSYISMANKNTQTKEVFLTHGYGGKKALPYMEFIFQSGCEVTYPTEFVKKESGISFKEIYHGNQVSILPSPRMDVVHFDPELNLLFRKIMNVEKNEKICLVMTTFRRNQDGTYDLTRPFPLAIDYNRLNEKLVESNVVMVIKLHHALDDVNLNVLPSFSNIRFAKNNVLLKNGFGPSSIMPYSDFFISDFSTAAVTYMMLNHPMGYILTDFEKYKKEIGGGFQFRNPEQYFVGSKIYNEEDLLYFINQASHGVDPFSEKRKDYSLLINGPFLQKGKACETIINHYLPNQR